MEAFIFYNCNQRKGSVKNKPFYLSITQLKHSFICQLHFYTGNPLQMINIIFVCRKTEGSRVFFFS